MGRYKVNYTYSEFSNNIHGKRVNSYDEFETDNAQDAVDQCRQGFYIEHELKITSVSKWSLAGYWMPVFENSWL